MCDSLGDLKKNEPNEASKAEVNKNRIGLVCDE